MSAASTSAAPNGNTSATPSPAPSSAAGAPAVSTKSAITSADVGWQFVPQYYTFVNKHPQRLHCFYTKNSTFIHGVEGEDGLPCTGQAAINERIEAIGFKDCKVYIHSVDSQPSAGGGIIIQVIGEMSNASGPWRKFAQTFFLAEQPNGYFVLNDIFRFLKEDTVADDDDEADDVADEYVKVEDAVPVAVPESKVEVAEKEEPIVPVAQEAAPKAAEQPKAVETPAPAAAAAAATPAMEEPVKSAVEEVSAAVATAAPTPVVNGQDDKAAPAAEKPAAEAASPVETPAPSAPAPAPTAPAQKATPPAAATAPAAPAKPAAPAAPKSWASLAKSGAGGAWGKPAPAAPAAAAAPAPVAAAPAPAAPKEAAPAPAAAAAAAAPAPAQQSAASGKKLSPQGEAALTVTTAQCFVKLANWAATNTDRDAPIDPELLRAALEARFGKVKELEIVKAKACAFLEFASVDSARRAILASLPVSHGGEGGVKVQDGRVLVETRKEKNERGPPRGGPRSLQPGANAAGGPPYQGQPGAGRGGRGGSQGGRGGARGGRPQAAPAAAK